MKNINHILIVFFSLLSTMICTSCMKNTDEDFYFRDALVEFDIATTTTNAPDRTYPLLSARARNAGVVSYRINLLGEQIDTDQELTIRVLAENSTAQEGLHYSLPNGNTVTLRANSSTAEFQVNILDFPRQSVGGPVVAVFEIVGNDRVKPSQNYKAIGVQISLR